MKHLLEQINECKETNKDIILLVLQVSEVSEKVLKAIQKTEKHKIESVKALIKKDTEEQEKEKELNAKIEELTNKAKRRAPKAEKNDLEKLTASAIGYGLLSVYGIKDKEYSNIQLGISNYICRQALDSSNKINAVDNLRQFSGRALTVLQGIEWLHSINIDYDTLETLINAVNIDKDIANGKFTDAARDKINEKIKELGFEITLKEDKE